MRIASLFFITALAGCGTKPDSSKTEPSSSASATEATPASAPAPSAAGSVKPASDTVTQASEKYDPGPSVIASGKVDGAALRKKHVERMLADHTPVTVLKGTGPLELGRRICEASVPKRAPQTPVLLKPNFCGYDGPKDIAKSGGDNGLFGRGTDPEFVRGVIQCLKARGHKAITIAEGCGHSHQMFVDSAHLTGFDTMAREEGVPLVGMDDDGVFDVEGDQPGKPLAIGGIASSHVPTLLLPKILAEHLDHGMFISIPKIKAHRFAVVSLAIKGMQGACSSRSK